MEHSDNTSLPSLAGMISRIIRGDTTRRVRRGLFSNAMTKPINYYSVWGILKGCDDNVPTVDLMDLETSNLSSNINTGKLGYKITTIYNRNLFIDSIFWISQISYEYKILRCKRKLICFLY